MHNQRYVTPANRALATQISALSEVRREDFEERAALLEYGGEMSRAAAEALALSQIGEGMAAAAATPTGDGGAASTRGANRTARPTGKPASNPTSAW